MIETGLEYLKSVIIKLIFLVVLLAFVVGSWHLVHYIIGYFGIAYWVARTISFLSFLGLYLIILIFSKAYKTDDEREDPET